MILGVPVRRVPVVLRHHALNGIEREAFVDFEEYGSLYGEQAFNDVHPSRLEGTSHISPALRD
jgi:hypothetical protein